jgi:hypothetical protein
MCKRKYRHTAHSIQMERPQEQAQAQEQAARAGARAYPRTGKESLLAHNLVAKHLDVGLEALDMFAVWNQVADRLRLGLLPGKLHANLEGQVRRAVSQNIHLTQCPTLTSSTLCRNSSCSRCLVLSLVRVSEICPSRRAISFTSPLTASILHPLEVGKKTRLWQMHFRKKEPNNRASNVPLTGQTSPGLRSSLRQDPIGGRAGSRTRSC